MEHCRRHGGRRNPMCASPTSTGHCDDGQQHGSYRPGCPARRMHPLADPAKNLLAAVPDGRLSAIVDIDSMPSPWCAVINGFLGNDFGDMVWAAVTSWLPVGPPAGSATAGSSKPQSTDPRPLTTS